MTGRYRRKRRTHHAIPRGLPPFDERRKSRDLDHLWPQDLHSQYLTATLRPRWLKHCTLCMAICIEWHKT